MLEPTVQEGGVVAMRSSMPVRPPKSRSEIMRAVPRARTVPEQRVSMMLRSIGCRYRMNDTRLPGSPDIVLKDTRVAIFVHGCFWHRHGCRAGRSTPRTNQNFWLEKFQNNRDRDRRKSRALRALGYRVWVIWECQTGRQAQAQLRRRLTRMLNQQGLHLNRDSKG